MVFTAWAARAIIVILHIEKITKQWLIVKLFMQGNLH